jgi:hypothetical protein
MINENINNLIEEVQFINEFDIDEEKLEKFNKGTMDTVKRSAGIASQIAVSGMISTAMPAWPVIGPILGAIVGGSISSFITSLLNSLMKDEQKINAYQKQLAQTQDPAQKAGIQTKINETKLRLSEKRTRLNKEKNDLIKQTNEMRMKIGAMERNKAKLSPGELVTLEKYKKIVANRMKVIPKLNA